MRTGGRDYQVQGRGEIHGEHTQGREEAESSTGTEPGEADSNPRGLPHPFTREEAHLLQQQPPAGGELGEEDLGRTGQLCQVRACAPGWPTPYLLVSCLRFSSSLNILVQSFHEA